MGLIEREAQVELQLLVFEEKKILFLTQRDLCVHQKDKREKYISCSDF